MTGLPRFTLEEFAMLRGEIDATEEVSRVLGRVGANADEWAREMEHWLDALAHDLDCGTSDRLASYTTAYDVGWRMVRSSEPQEEPRPAVDAGAVDGGLAPERPRRLERPSYELQKDAGEVSIDEALVAPGAATEAPALPFKESAPQALVRAPINVSPPIIVGRGGTAEVDRAAIGLASASGALPFRSKDADDQSAIDETAPLVAAAQPRRPTLPFGAGPTASEGPSAPTGRVLPKTEVLGQESAAPPMNEEPQGLTLERYIEVSVAIAEAASRDDVLARHGLSAAAWARESKAWSARITKDRALMSRWQDLVRTKKRGI